MTLYHCQIADRALLEIESVMSHCVDLLANMNRARAAIRTMVAGEDGKAIDIPEHVDALREAVIRAHDTANAIPSRREIPDSVACCGNWNGVHLSHCLANRPIEPNASGRATPSVE